MFNIPSMFKNAILDINELDKFIRDIVIKFYNNYWGIPLFSCEGHICSGTGKCKKVNKRWIEELFLLVYFFNASSFKEFNNSKFINIHFIEDSSWHRKVLCNYYNVKKSDIKNNIYRIEMKKKKTEITKKYNDYDFYADKAIFWKKINNRIKKVKDCSLSVENMFYKFCKF